MPCFFFVRLWARCSRTFVRSAPCPRLPRLVRLAPRLVNVWQEITTPLRMLAFRDFQRLLCVRLSLCFKHAPRLVLVFLGFCRLLFGKTPLCKQKSSVQDAQPSTTSVVLFLCQAVGKVLTYLCTFRSLSSPSSTCAPCSAFGQRLARDNNSATHARLSRFSTLALRPIISLFQTRSAPCPRLYWLLPFALWQSRIP